MAELYACINKSRVKKKKKIISLGVKLLLVDK